MLCFAVLLWSFRYLFFPTLTDTVFLAGFTGYSGTLPEYYQALIDRLKMVVIYTARFGYPRQIVLTS